MIVFSTNQHSLESLREEDKSLDSSIQQARQELHRLRQKREQQQLRRDRTVQDYQERYEKAQTKINSKLKTRPSHSVLMAHLKKRHLQEDGPASLPPLYVLKQETNLMSNMMYSFSVLQRQRGMLEAHHDDMERFLTKERVKVFMDLDDANRQTLLEVTKAAETYSTGYDNYQKQLEGLFGEKRKLSVLLQEKQDDATSLGLSDTDHSSLSDGSDGSTFGDDDETLDDENSFNGDSSFGSRFKGLSRKLRGRVSGFRAAAGSQQLSVS